MPNPVHGSWLAGLLALALGLVPYRAGAAPQTLVLAETTRLAVSGLVSPTSMVVSPDGLHVYVANVNGDGLVVFGQGPTLAFVESVVDGENGVTGMNGPIDLAISPDGAHVYVTGVFSDSLAVFSRDAGTGELTFVEEQVDGLGGVAALDDPIAVTVSPDGAHVYVAAFAPGNAAVVVFSRDAGTGALTFVESQMNGSGGVSDMTTPVDVAVSPDGAHVYVAAYVDDAIVAFERDDLTGTLSFLGTVSNGVGGVSGIAETRSVVVSPDGAHVYATGVASDGVAAFSRDGGTGLLAFVGAQAGLGGMDGARTVTLSPDGLFAYVTGPGSDALTRFARNPGTGALIFEAVLFDGSGGDGLRQVRDAAIGPDGTRLFTAGFGESSIGVFDRDTGTGVLTFVDEVVNGETTIGLDNVQALAMTADGRHLYAASANSDAVVLFDRDDVTDGLAFVEAHLDDALGVDGLDGVFDIALSPDEAHLYVAGAADDAIAVFARDDPTGQLTFVEAVFQGGGVTGLADVSRLALSPDGAHLYATSNADDTVSTFSRDAGTGALTFVETLEQGVGGLVSLNGAFGVTVTPDGAHVYVTSTASDMLTLFARDPGTGQLTFVQLYDDDAPGIDGLNGAAGVLVSPDGLHVYVAADLEGRVAHFTRAPLTGLLTFVEAVSNVGGTHLALSPDGTTLYVARSGTLGAYGRDPATGVLQLEDSVATDADDLVLSPDGASIYTADGSGDAIDRFVRGFGGCDAAPAAGCHLSAEVGGSKLLVVDRGVPEKNKMTWKWLAKGEGTVAADLGDPESSTSYALCIYEESGPPVLVHRSLMARSNVWWDDVFNGFKYVRKDAAPEGITSASIKAKIEGKGNLKVKGKGAQLAIPPVPAMLPLRVQLQHSEGECWEATFSPAGVRKNGNGKFLGVSE
jgi:6-phosphogluconolactonase (cycloisomerase 2 family)